MELTPFEREMIRQNERQIQLLEKIRHSTQWIGIVATLGFMFVLFALGR